MRLLTLLLLSLLLQPGAFAGNPDTVTVGTYVNQIFGVDLKNNAFHADFYIWFRWTNDAIKPLDSVQLINGRINSKTAVTYRRVGNVNVASARIEATITKFWDMSRFPLDRHSLTLQFEDTRDANGIVFLADTANSAMSPEIQVPGWKVDNARPEVKPHLYNARQLPESSSPGSDLPLQRAESTFSRYTYTVFIDRPGYGRFIKVFLGLFVSVLVAYLAFFVRPKDLSPRVSLGVGAIFAVAASSFSINNMLPESATLTMADKLVMAALSCVAVSILGTILSVQLTYHGKDKQSIRFDHICAGVLPVFYAALFVYVVGF